MTVATIHRARVVSLRGPAGYRRGAQLRDLGVIERGWVTVRDGLIHGVGEGEPPELIGEIHDAHGATLLPLLVDAHTHLLWAGRRDDEWALKWSGTPYLEIVKRGGGIMSSVRATRAASDHELDHLLRTRLAECRMLGSGAIEVKTGYGLRVEDEFRMLESILRVAAHSPAPVVPTFLGGHALDPGLPTQVEAMIDEGLPRLAERLPGAVVDAFCDDGGWSLEQCRRYLERARDLGLRLRLHADQFSVKGGVEMAVELGALSVDHLEASGEPQLRRLAGSETAGVVLPCCGFALDGRFAPARRLVDMGGAIVVASNANPGSAPSLSLAFSMALAVRHLGLTPAEALTAATWNAAVLLGLDREVGSIEVGKRADLMMVEGSELSLIFDVAGPGPRWSMIGGQFPRRLLP
ncbi:MAG: imidazolonepropionase [Phycisphaeraceae bacterium]|nr:imidazolonepropionase [Phycisphaeraceae bacterium]